MILTCPQCATRYFLPEGSVGPGGRAVRCTQCAHVWQAHAEATDEAQDLAPPPEPEPPAPEPDVEDEMSTAALRRGEILRYQKAEAARKQRQAAAVGAAIWAGLAAAVVLSLALAVIFRVQVVQLWPGTASAYAAAGLPVNATGLLIDKVDAVPQVLGAQRALVVTGVVANASGQPRPVPAFRVRVQNHSGATLAERTITVSGPPIQVAESRRFSLTVANPPSNYEMVEVTLAVPDVAAPGPGVH